MECENCGNPKMEFLEKRKQWICQECGSFWTYESLDLRRNRRFICNT